MLHIYNSTETGKETIDIYTVFYVTNVNTYDFDRVNFDSWNITRHDTIIEQPNMTYFILDSHFDDAFGHWAFESAIYLPLFIKLKERFPTMKLLLKEKRTYKSLFCSFFNIKEEDIAYTIDSPVNTCIFPSPINALNCQQISEEYTEQLKRFYLHFIEYKSIQTDTILVMPRQKKENYPTNNRICDMNAIISYLETKNREIKHTVFHTDTVTNLIDQINIVSSAKSIIVSDGSALSVNAMFAREANIYILGNITPGQACVFAKVNKIIEFSKTLSKNTHTYFNSDKDIIEYIKVK